MQTEPRHRVSRTCCCSPQRFPMPSGHVKSSWVKAPWCRIKKIHWSRPHFPDFRELSLVAARKLPGLCRASARANSIDRKSSRLPSAAATWTGYCTSCRTGQGPLLLGAPSLSLHTYKFKSRQIACSELLLSRPESAALLVRLCYVLDTSRFC